MAPPDERASTNRQSAREASDEALLSKGIMMHGRSALLLTLGCLPILVLTVRASQAQHTDHERTWNGVARVGYPIVTKNSAHPVDIGIVCLSGAIHKRAWHHVTLGLEFGYQTWRNDDEPDPYWPNRKYPKSLSIVSPTILWHFRAPAPSRRIDPYMTLSLGLCYRQRQPSGGNFAPAIAYGAGVRYLPGKEGDGSTARIGFGLVIRRHEVMADDYGAWFAGPSHYWTRTIEISPEIFFTL